MLIDAVSWLVSTAIVLIFVTVGVRAGAALVRVRDISMGRSFAIATSVLAVEVVCGVMVTVGTSKFNEPLAPIVGVAGLVLGIATPFVVLKLMLRQGWGRTIVVWAVHGVAAVFGFAAAGAIMSPGVAGAREKAAQARTISDIKNSAAALEAWMAASQVAGGEVVIADASGRGSRFDVNDLTLISGAELRALVAESAGSSYRENIPDTDGWGHPFEYRVDRDADTIRRLCIRSPGKDGVFEGQMYEAGGFDRSEYDRDVVWADGGLVRWPE